MFIFTFKYQVNLSTEEINFCQINFAIGRAIWHIGMSGAFYAADPGSIPGESNTLFSEI